MRRAISLAAGLGATLALAAGLPGGALAADSAESELGEHIASCAQMQLGQREDPPTLTCEQEGHMHTFATFGAMVEHMLEGHE